MTLIATQPYFAHTDYLCMIRVSGIDAKQYLQSQITCDVTLLQENNYVFSACCDPTGRMLATFLIGYHHAEFFLLLPQSMLDITLTHFKKFIFRAKVNFETINQLPAFIQSQNVPDENAWRLQNIRLGMVWIYPQTRCLLIPQMINLQKWGGLSFNKGCYVGQEIIARTENLGKLKRHLYQASIDTQQPPRLGDELLNENSQPIGIVVEIAKAQNSRYQLLAVLQDQLFTASSNIDYQSTPLQNILIIH